MESEVTAKFLCPLPSDRNDVETGWPDHELLIRCGAEFLADPEAGRRIVKLHGDIFVEGNIAEWRATWLGDQEAN